MLGLHRGTVRDAGLFIGKIVRDAVHYFTGNAFTGCFFHEKQLFTPEELWPLTKEGKVVWEQTVDSGDFLWPHLKTERGLIALDYNE